MTTNTPDPTDLDGWADLLASSYDVLDARAAAGRALLPAAPQPLNALSDDDAYLVQDKTLQRLQDRRGHTARGYKVGGGASLMCGVLLDGALLQSGATVDVDAHNVPLVEPEILLRTTAELAGEVSPAELARSVEMTAGFELPVGRFRTWHPMAPGSATTLTSMIADNGLAGLLVVGGPWRAGLDPLDVAQVTAEVEYPDEPAQTGRPNPQVGTAYDTTRWLVSNLARRGRTLPAGSIIATGTLLPARPAVRGEYAARFSHDLGEVRFTAV